MGPSTVLSRSQSTNLKVLTRLLQSLPRRLPKGDGTQPASTRASFAWSCTTLRAGSHGYRLGHRRRGRVISLTWPASEHPEGAAAALPRSHCGRLPQLALWVFLLAVALDRELRVTCVPTYMLAACSRAHSSPSGSFANGALQVAVHCGTGNPTLTCVGAWLLRVVPFATSCTQSE